MTPTPSLQSRRVVLTNAQIKTLPTTTVEVVPAPGLGKALLFMRALLDPSYTAGYTNIGDAGASTLWLSDTLAVSRVTVDKPLQNAIADDPSNARITTLAPRGDGLDQLAPNSPLRLEAYNSDANGNNIGAFTGGDPANTLTVAVFYLTVDV
jgi:hypothetical protein